MKYVGILFLFMSCAHTTPSQEKDYVTLDAALNQAQASYLKGCVMALRDLNIPSVFTGCRDKAILHREELNSMLGQNPSD